MESHSSCGPKKDSDRTLAQNATPYAPPKSEGQENSDNELSENAVSVKPHAATDTRTRPGSSAPNTSSHGTAVSASTPRLPPSSSLGSLSTLNPHAKEFKLNPNAKSFTPNPTTLRPTSPVSDGSYYYQATVTAVPNMHGIPVAIGVGQSFGGHQPVMFNPQAASMQSPQSYFHPNGPQYGQQMILGQPRQVVFMPTYPQEMQYKGREF